MERKPKYYLTEAEKDSYIDALTPELAALRTKADISQKELAEILGISRQTYSSMERNVRRMSWTTYLALILFYDCNKLTRPYLRSVAYPYDMIRRFNGSEEKDDYNLGDFLETDERPMLDMLDEQALRSIRTMILIEVARCTSK